MSAPTDPPGATARRFGRFELRRMLGRSGRSMLWRAHDPSAGHELLLLLPRAQPIDATALDDWLAEARRAARLLHPALAPAAQIGEQERWPYLACDGALGLTLPEWLAAHPAPPPTDVARWLADALQGLAYAHDAGFAHRDLQPHLLLIGDGGQARLFGLGAVQGAAVPPRGSRALADDRAAAEADVLAAGLLLHQLLSGRAAFGEADLGNAIERLAPRGREVLRLPGVTPHPLPPALRAITDRATGQPAQRYLSARTLQQALDGWREAHDGRDGGALALLLERVEHAGHLPALPGVSARALRLSRMERGRLHELAELVLEDPALAIELLREVNGSAVRALQATGGGAVLTVRRAIALLGLDGVRRAAQRMRGWPGPLDDAAAGQLRALCERVQQAARLAVSIRPAGFDAEVVFVVAVLQNLGRLLVQYHFPVEAAQLRALPRLPAVAGETDAASASEGEAAMAVFGIELDDFAQALARHWALPTELHLLMRRLDPALPVRTPRRDEELLRTVASCANEAIDVLALPAARRNAALERVAQRHARALGLPPRDLAEALREHGAAADLAGAA